VFVAMSFFSLRKLRNQHNTTTPISDDRYYELKYKLQFITSVGIIIIGVCGFLGYDKFENFVKDFDKKTDSLNIKLGEYDTKISLMDSNIVKYDNKIAAYSNILDKLDLSKIKFSKAMVTSNKELLNLKDTIDVIKKRNILDKSFYVIDNLKVKNGSYLKNKDESQKFYFKNMYTIIGDKVPEFDKSPVIFVIPQSTANISIISVTKDYVEVSFSTYMGTQGKEEPETFAFGLLISRKL
jgi:hypothetical protein